MHPLRIDILKSKIQVKLHICHNCKSITHKKGVPTLIQIPTIETVQLASEQDNISVYSKCHCY